MDQKLDHAIDLCVAEFARACLAPSGAASSTRLVHELRTALRLLDGEAAGGKLVSREKAHWLMQEVTRRLCTRVENRLASSSKLGLDQEGKAALHSALGETFDAAMRALDGAL